MFPAFISQGLAHEHTSYKVGYVIVLTQTQTHTPTPSGGPYLSSAWSTDTQAENCKY